MKLSKKSRFGLALALLAALSTANAWACEVCYGAADAPVIDGMNMSVIFLLATTYFVLISMGLTFVVARRRALRLQPAGAADGEGA